jgi:polymorphic toxin system DSP-PTPase phosphatase-like protein
VFRVPVDEVNDAIATRSTRASHIVTGLVIYGLSVGDGILALSALPGAGGDFADDLEHIHDWQPGLVISLTTRVEMVGAGAETLGTDLQSMASRWVHLPIADFGVPPPDVAQRWPDVSRSARQALEGGGRVLIHCRGGCGRSGMMVLRLMIEAGESPDAALARLRNLRPCAVETQAQMDWALAGSG